MWVISIKKMKLKLFLLGVFLLLIVFSMVGYKLHENDIQARVNRSNAMQVSKTMTPEQILPAALPDFFTEYRLERDKLRSERSEILRESIKSAKTEDARQTAQTAILRTIQEKQQETEMENLIRARGFADALVFIRDNAVNAVVKAPSLTRDDVIQIAEVISKVSGVKTEDITISAKQ
jgi:stage III sporulation protein AH